MLAVALEKATTGRDGDKKRDQSSLPELNGLGASGNLFANQAHPFDLSKINDLGDTMRGLVSNEAGEALYDSERNLYDKVTESHVSMPRSLGSLNKRSRKSGSRKSRKASVVLEEPSKEDHGYTFCSRYSFGHPSLRTGSSVRSSNKYIKSTKSGKGAARALGSTININIRNDQSHSPSRFKRNTSLVNSASPSRSRKKSSHLSPTSQIRAMNNSSPRKSAIAVIRNSSKASSPGRLSKMNSARKPANINTPVSPHRITQIKTLKSPKCMSPIRSSARSSRSPAARLNVRCRESIAKEAAMIIE